MTVGGMAGIPKCPAGNGLVCRNTVRDSRLRGNDGKGARERRFLYAIARRRMPDFPAA